MFLSFLSLLSDGDKGRVWKTDCRLHFRFLRRSQYQISESEDVSHFHEKKKKPPDVYNKNPEFYRYYWIRWELRGASSWRPSKMLILPAHDILPLWSRFMAIMSVSIRFQDWLRGRWQRLGTEWPLVIVKIPLKDSSVNSCHACGWMAFLGTQAPGVLLALWSGGALTSILIPTHQPVACTSA